MGDAVIGSLRVVLGLDAAKFEDGLSKAQKQLRGIGRQFQAVGQQMSQIGAGMSVAITAPLIAAGFAASRAATEAADAMGQVEAALTSMGNASGRTSDQLADMASGIMRNSLYDDDDILRKVTANLLTFGNVAGTVFDRAQVVAADLATRMQMDLQPATLLVGKALNDPIKGMTALGRAGIQFTAAQKNTIKAMVATGNVAGAQGLILTELERQFGGAAAAAQRTEPYDRLRDVLNDLSESAGAIINTALAPMLEKVASLADRFNQLSPQMQGFAIAGAAVAAALGPALVVIGSVVSAIGALTTAFASGGVLAGLAGFAAAAVPFVAAGAAIAAVVWAFRDDLAPVFEQFRQATEAALGPPLQQLMASAREAFAAMAPAIKTIIDVVGPVLAKLTTMFLQAFGPVVLTALRVLVAGITNAFGLISRAVQVVAAVLSGDWSGAWRAAGSLAMEAMRSVGRIAEAIFPGIGRIVGRMVDEVRGFLGRQLAAVFDGVVSKIRVVGDAFYTLWDRVVGHSYIPDLVEGVGSWMAKLDAVMVEPARRAAETTAEAFEGVRDRARAAMEGLLTDDERAWRDHANTVRDLQAGIAQGGPAAEVFRQGLARENAGWDARGITVGPDRDLQSIDLSGAMRPVNEAIERMNRSITESRDRFADAFAGGMEAAMHGDWQGLLRSIVGDVFGSAMRRLGASLFDIGGGGKGGFNIGTAISGMFKNLPKFKDGGTVAVGGYGGIG